MTVKCRIIHFIAQDEGSIKALLPVFARFSSWVGVATRFFCTKKGLEHLEARGWTGREFPGPGRYPPEEEKPDLIVAGASMWDSIEKHAISCALAKGIPSLVIVDHGSNFWGRFSVTGERELSALPARILAPDEESRERMCLAGFPPERIVVTGNPSFDAFRPDTKRGELPSRRSILFVMQPERREGRYHSDESCFPLITALAAEFASQARVIVRPHPKEDPVLYRFFELAGIVVDHISDISDLVRQSDIVIGNNSTALIEAVFRGKAVTSFAFADREYEPLPTERMGLSAVARSESELREWIGALLGRTIATRELKKIRYYNDGGNTERVVACLLSMLSEAPTAADPSILPGRMTDV